MRVSGLNISTAPAFLRFPGEMANLIAGFDWSTTPLGPIAAWPQSLKTIVGMMVAAPNPMVLLWGQQGTLIYNDSYARFAGRRHPQLLGMGAREGWPEIADFNDNNIRRGLAGEAWSLEAQELVLDRRGLGPESAWLDLHYTPVLNDQGVPAGIMVFVDEITDRVKLDLEQIKARERFDLALSAGRGVGAWDWDVVTDIVRADRRFARLYGVDPDAAERGAPISEFFRGVHPDDLPRLQAAVDYSRRTGAPFSAEYRLRQGDETHWVLAEGRCVLSPDGAVIRLPGVSFDISDRKRVEARQAALLDLHNAIRDLDDPTGIAAAAARLSGEVLGCDQAVYASVEIEADTLVVEKDWTAEGYVPLTGRIPLRDYGDFVDDLRLGRVTAISDVTVHPQTRHAAEAYEKRRVRSIVDVPVLERDRLVAILSVNCGKARNWSAEDLAFLREVAERTRSAVERARAAQAVRASEARLRFLDALNLEVARIPDADQILATTTRMICQHLSAAACAYADVDDDQDSLTIRGEWSAPEAPSMVGRYSLNDFGQKTVADLREGHPLVANDIAVDLGDDAAAGFSALGGIKATICMPLVKDGRLIALMAVHSTEARQWTVDETALVHEVTERSWAHIERVRSEAERAESEDRYRALFTTMDEGFCVIEFVDGPEGPLSDYVHVDANAAYEQNTGLPRVIGQRMRDMLPAEADGWVALYRSVLETGRPLRFEKELQATDRWLELAAFRIEPPERRQVAVIFKDLTARKLAEKALEDMNASLEAHVEVRTQELIAAHEALRQSQKMEAVGQLTGGIAHDFNNLLAGISGSLEIINKRLVQGRSAEIGRYVEAAQGASQRAAALTQRLLAFSRRQTLDPRPTDVNRLIDSMEDLIRRTVGPDVAVEVHAANHLWPVKIDRSQLENALLNLCINARDAMVGGGGQLRIETANETLSSQAALERELPAGDYIALRVTDTGAGIRPEITERIFDPFFTTKPIGQGTGLGLSMIHGFVQQSGGQIQVLTELGVGTTMCLYLPRHAGQVEDMDEPAAIATSDARADGRRVLIIDDESSVRVLVAEVLREQGYAVLEADNGPAGLRLLDGDAEIDLLITDVGLPGGMNGRQVADAARVRRPELKVLFITGYAENAAVGNGLLAPGMEVMTKPFVIADLSARATSMIETTAASTNTVV